MTSRSATTPNDPFRARLTNGSEPSSAAFNVSP